MTDFCVGTWLSLFDVILTSFFVGRFDIGITFTISILNFWSLSVLSSDNLILLPATNFKFSWPVGVIDVVVPINPLDPLSITVVNVLQWLPKPIVTAVPEELTVNPSSFLKVMLLTFSVVTFSATVSTEPITLRGEDTLAFNTFPLKDRFKPASMFPCLLSNCVCMDDVTPSTKFSSSILVVKEVVPSFNVP